MTRPVSSLPNLGPATDAAFARIGVTTAEELIALGADAAYRRLLEAGARPHFIGYYVLVLAIQGRPWLDLDPVEKAALRLRFDAIKAEATRLPAPLAALEAALDRLGVVPAPASGASHGARRKARSAPGD